MQLAVTALGARLDEQPVKRARLVIRAQGESAAMPVHRLGERRGLERRFLQARIELGAPGHAGVGDRGERPTEEIDRAARAELQQAARRAQQAHPVQLVQRRGEAAAGLPAAARGVVGAVGDG